MSNEMSTTPDAKDTTAPALEGKGLNLAFGRGTRRLQAIRKVDITVPVGKTVALVGESGSGKSTTARVLVGAQRADEGEVFFYGQRIDGYSNRQMFPIRHKMQLIFQDPLSSLDPKMTAEQIIAESLAIQDGVSLRDARPRVAQVLQEVGLGEDAMTRRPNEFSGGQRQRLAIARAIILDPEVLVGDEIVSALDVSIQAQILTLLQRLRAERGLSMLMISHDLTLMNSISDFIYVMYLGRIVETGTASQVFRTPAHPYTVALVAATLHIESTEDLNDPLVPRGEPPSPIDPPTGCHYHPRCPARGDRCAVEAPPLSVMDDGRSVACFYPQTLTELISIRQKARKSGASRTNKEQESSDASS